MSTPNPYDSIVRFSTFELDFSGRELRKSGLRLRCQEQPLQVLAALLEKPGVLISREELRQRVWSEDTFVDFDHALNTAVKKLRNVLSDNADAPRYIETVPRRGYRFIGAIQPEPQVLVTQSSARVMATDSSPSFRRHIILIAILGVVLASIVVYYLNSHRAKASGAVAFVRPALLAVLPFQNMTSDPAQDSFSDGMTEETTTHLARLNSSRFHVVARTSAMKYKGAGKGIDEIARELHADYLLEGSIRREGRQVRISCQLIRASDQAPRWSQEFNFDSGDSLTMETRAADTIASQLNAILGDPGAPQHHLVDDAFDSYLRGLAESSIHTPEGLEQIIAAFQKPRSTTRIARNLSQDWLTSTSAAPIWVSCRRVPPMPRHEPQPNIPSGSILRIRRRTSIWLMPCSPSITIGRGRRPKFRRRSISTPMTPWLMSGTVHFCPCRTSRSSRLRKCARLSNSIP